MAVEDRLGDPRLPGDLGRRRPAVALLEEDAAGGVEHRLPAILRPVAAAGPFPASSRGLSRHLDLERDRARAVFGRAGLRTVRSATTEPASAITARDSSAVCSAFVNATRPRSSPGRREARREPRGDDRAHQRRFRASRRPAACCSARPSRRLPCRVRTADIAAAVVGVIVSAIPAPPMSIAGSRCQ